MEKSKARMVLIKTSVKENDSDPGGLNSWLTGIRALKLNTRARLQRPRLVAAVDHLALRCNPRIAVAETPREWVSGPQRVVAARRRPTSTAPRVPATPPHRVSC